MSRRWKRLLIQPNVLVHCLNGKFEVIANAVPYTARIVNCSYDSELHHWDVLIEDESFDEVEEGTRIPEMVSPLIRRIEP